jgi:hypothetical protein
MDNELLSMPMLRKLDENVARERQAMLKVKLKVRRNL